MPTLKCEVEIQAPPRAIFHLLTNYRLNPWFNHGIGWKIEKVTITTDKKQGKGVQTSWVKIEEGKSSYWEEEITDWIENEYVSYKSVTGPSKSGSHTLKPTDKGTKLTSTRTLPDDFSNNQIKMSKEHLLTLQENVKVVLEHQMKLIKDRDKITKIP